MKRTIVVVVTVASLLVWLLGSDKSQQSAAASASSQLTVAAVPQSKPAVTHRYAARQFNSKVPLEVWVKVNDREWNRHIGRTSANKPLGK